MGIRNTFTRWLPTRLPTERGHRRPRSVPRLAIESLEDRTVPARLYVDFGSNLPAGILTVADADMQVAGVNGPASISAALSSSGADSALFGGGYPLSSVLSNLQARGMDLTGDGVIDQNDDVFLKTKVLLELSRIFQPYNVTVTPVGITAVGDILPILAASGERDAYIFVGGAAPGTFKNSTNITGFAPVDAGNSKDNTGFAFADSILAVGAAGAAVNIAENIAHEAGHTFGLNHTDETQAIVAGDVMSRTWGNNTTNLFTRYPLPLTGGGTQNAFDALASATDIGLRTTGPAYVTGTGAHDKITIARTSATTAFVKVVAYANSNLTGPIYTYQYSVNTTNGIVVEAGEGSDRVIVDGNLGRRVYVRGGNGLDTAQLNAPAGASTVGVDTASASVGTTSLVYDDFGETEVLAVNGNARTSVLIPAVNRNVTIMGAGTVTVGNGLTADVIGQVAIKPTSVLTKLTVDDSLNTSGRTVEVSFGGSIDNGVPIYGISGLSPTPILYNPNFVASLNLKTGTGADSFKFGDNFSDLTFIPTPVTVSGGGGIDTLLVDGSNTLDSAFVVTDHDVKRSQPFTLRGRTTYTLTNTFNYTGIEFLTVKGGSSTGSLFTVQTTGANTPVALVGGYQTDTFVIGDRTSSVGGVVSPVTVDGQDGADTLTLDDRLTPTVSLLNESTSFAVTDHDVTRYFSGGPRGFETNVTSVVNYGAVEDVKILGRGRGTTFAVTTTAAGTPVEIQGGAEADSFVIGDATHSLDGLASLVTLDGKGGADTLVFNDTATAVEKGYVLDVDHFDRGVSNEVTPPLVQFVGMNGTTLNTSSGGSKVGVVGTTIGNPVTVNGAAGAVDQFGVDTSFNGIHGAVALHGQLADGDFASISDYQNTASNNIYTMTATTAKRSSQSLVTFDGLGQVIMATASAGGNQVNVRGVGPDTFANLSINNGDVVTIGSAAPGISGSLATVQGGVAVSSVATTDHATLIVDDSTGTIGKAVVLAPPTGLPGDIGSSAIGLNAGGIFWNLGTGSDLTFRGGIGNDSFVVRGILPPINLTINGGGGRDLLIAGNNLATLIGGGGEDILIAGTTDYDADAMAIQSIMTEWSRLDEDYATRVANLTTGVGVPLLDATTVHSNGLGNHLTGGDGATTLDLFFGRNGLDIMDRVGAEVLIGL